MELELTQLDRRYERLRLRQPRQEGRLLSSLSQQGQQVPIVVVALEGSLRWLVIDGFKRLRALERLGAETVVATAWELSQAEALVLDRALRTGPRETELEQGWLLRELRESFGWSRPELALRFDRSLSWVSRRLALVSELPAAIQELVRRGRLSAQAAMKSLVPLARVEPEACSRLAEAVACAGLSQREIATLVDAFRNAAPATRERLLADPRLFLSARAELTRPVVPLGAAERLRRELEQLGLQAHHFVHEAQAESAQLAPGERERLSVCLGQILVDLERCRRSLQPEEENETQPEEKPDARPTDPDDDSQAPPRGPRPTLHRPDPGAGATHDPERAALGQRAAPAQATSAESRAAPREDPRAVSALPGQPGAGARGAASGGSSDLLLGPDRLLSPPRDRQEGEDTGGRVPLPAGPGDPTRHLDPHR
jgi:ParB/RepB/Spo0J family partition protein